jgi:hypothetical protein
MHSLASSLPPIPPRRIPAPRCTITRSRPSTPLNPPTVTLAPEPWIRGAFFHTPPDRPNSPIRAERLCRKPQIGARIQPNRVQRRRGGSIGKFGDLGVRSETGARRGVWSRSEVGRTRREGKIGDLGRERRVLRRERWLYGPRQRRRARLGRGWGCGSPRERKARAFPSFRARRSLRAGLCCSAGGQFASPPGSGHCGWASVDSPWVGGWCLQ